VVPSQRIVTLLLTRQGIRISFTRDLLIAKRVSYIARHIVLWTGSDIIIIGILGYLAYLMLLGIYNFCYLGKRLLLEIVTINLRQHTRHNKIYIVHRWPSLVLAQTLAAVTKDSALPPEISFASLVDNLDGEHYRKYRHRPCNTTSDTTS